MSITTVASLTAPANPPRDAVWLARELDSLRLLLLRAAEALCAGDASRVQQACNDLDAGAANLCPAFGELFPKRAGVSLAESEQQRRRLLKPLLEARALYLAALRRWRRSLGLRRSLMKMQQDALAYDAAELSRWY